MKKLYLILLLLLLYRHAFAQTQRITSLKQAVHAEHDPEKQFNTLITLLDEHESIYKDSLQPLVDHATVLAKGINTKEAYIKTGIAQVNAYLRFDKLNTATHLVDSLLKLVDSNKQNEKSLFVALSLQKINTYAAAAKYEPAIALLYRTLAIAQQIKDTAAQAQCMNTLGVIHYNLNKLDEQMKWHRRIIALCGGKEKYNRANAYCYINMMQNLAWQEKYDSATYYFNLAVPICEKIENLYYLANAYIIQSTALKWSGHLPQAQQYLLKAIDIRRRSEGNITFSNEQLALANMYVSEKDFKKAIDVYQAGINYAADSIRSKGNEVNYVLLFYYYEGLSRCYHLTGAHELYEASLENMLAIKDTINKFNSETAMAEMQTKYEVQLKDNTIIRQKLDIAQKNLLFYGSLVVTVLLLIIAWLVFSNYKRRQKTKLYLMQEEEKRKAIWAIKEAEEKERKRIAADLHDNMGSYAAGIKANVEELMSQTSQELPAMENLRANSQQMVALLGDTIWALKKEELTLSAISDRLKVFIQRLRASYPHIEFNIEEHIAEDLKLPPVQAYHLFMTVQEAINNGVRHSRGNEITIRIKSDTANWKITVQDNGKGIQANNADNEGNGLYNMRSRADESGWNIQWQPAQPKGTAVIITNIN